MGEDGTFGVVAIVIGLMLVTIIGIAALMWGSESKQVAEAQSFAAKGGLVLDETVAVYVPWIGNLFGWLLLVIGTLAAIVSFFLPTSIETYGASDVHNIGMMQTQLMVLLLGLAMFVGGLMLICVAALIRYLRP